MKKGLTFMLAASMHVAIAGGSLTKPAFSPRSPDKFSLTSHLPLRQIASSLQLISNILE